MSSTKNKNISILIAVLIAGLSVLYKNNFAPEALIAPESLVISPKIEENIDKIEQINFDISVFNDPKFATFTSIESELPSIPVGRVNPFAAVVGR